MAAKERINETISDVMDKMDDLFWTIREYYSKDMTPDQFAQEVFAQFQTKLDKLKDDLNDELYDDEEVEYTPCDVISSKANVKLMCSSIFMSSRLAVGPSAPSLPLPGHSNTSTKENSGAK